MARPKVHCHCGLTITQGRSHYPANDPENGPAHKPHPPCPLCGQPPHSGRCYPPCQCEAPNAVFCGGLHLCAHCGDEVNIGASTLAVALSRWIPNQEGN